MGERDSQLANERVYGEWQIEKCIIKRQKFKESNKERAGEYCALSGALGER